MQHFVLYSVCLCVLAKHVFSCQYRNETALPDAASQQLPEFRQRQQVPKGIFTKITGEPMDIRDTVTLNTEIFDNRNFFRVLSHQNRERIPERVVHAKGNGAFGYFEVTHDVSRYTKADVYNGIGKRTPIMVRFSTNRQPLGGADVIRDPKSLALKLYTKEGILDHICFHIPLFFYKDPILFGPLAHALRRNPRTLFYDQMVSWDLMTFRPETLHANLYILSDFGIPNGYRKTDYFPIHTYEIYNKLGERFFAKFSLRTETGSHNLSNAEARVISVEDPSYNGRDLYNAIAANQYPSWRLEMDVLTADQITNVDFDPFDVTRRWKRGTYRTVPIGRIVINRRVDNHFKDVEQAAFSPGNLVPGISGPIDQVFKSRSVFYRDAQNYRLGVNQVNIAVNAPLNKKTYSRDGRIPALDNMRDAPNYYPNSFNGPVPYVDEKRPKDLPVVIHSNAVDLQPIADFYNEILESDAHRQRVAENVAGGLILATPFVQNRALRIFSLIDLDLGRRVNVTLMTLRQISQQERLDQLTQCFVN